MRKLFLFFLLFVIVSASSEAQNNNRLFDQPMKIKSLIIRIDADPFTATTFIEMEFFNPNNREIEGLYRFQLNPGQVITAFQLDLNGKYRDGSIEEKWKARNAYNTIVGKRIDPALLQMEGLNQYRLNIYPVPAKSSRKITMTIQQRMKAGEKTIDYFLPFSGKDTADYFRTVIHVHHTQSIPFAIKGLLPQQTFDFDINSYKLDWESEDVALTQPIAFSIPLNDRQFVYCTKQVNRKTYFAVQYKPSIKVLTDIHPKKITIFWDISASADKRQTGKEINFLEQYVSYHNISQLAIIPFNHRTTDTAIFFTGNRFNSRWQQYLRSLEYDGATQLGMLDFSSLKTDAVFLFSDGKSTYGKSIPKSGNALVYCISSSASVYPDVLTKIAGTGGGCYINLDKTSISEALMQAGRSENWLLHISSSKGKTIYEQQLPIRVKGPVFINGTMESRDDTLLLSYGTNNSVSKTEKLYIANSGSCNTSAIERINMFEKFELFATAYWWEDMLEFGLKEKVVTPHTSYIVLERVEDYIKYNISPPKELEDECKELGFVKKDSRSQRQQMREKDQFDLLNGFIGFYNEKLKQWDETSAPVSINIPDLRLAKITAMQKNAEKNLTASVSSINNEPVGFSSLENESSLSEVVVVAAYGMNRSQRSVGYSVTTVRSPDLFASGTVEQVLQGRVAGVSVSNANPQPGSFSSINIRGRGAAMGFAEPLFVLDGIPVQGNINDYISTTMIENITILKDAPGTALYGSRGANGVILITSKKPKTRYNYPDWNSPYRLKDMEDVEYLQEIKSAELTDKWNLYRQLKVSYGNDPGFYFDIAQHFFDVDMKEEALPVLMNAAEAAEGDYRVLKAIGYTLESWKYFGQAVEVYNYILQLAPMNLYAYRDLAWAYYQQGKYQDAVDLLYKALTTNFDWQEDQIRPFKAMLLSEMNAVIAIHKDKIRTDAIPVALLKPMPVDLRIVVDGNKMDFYNVSIQEPGGTVCSNAKPVSKKGGYMNKGVYHYYSNGPQEYQLRFATEGKYRITVNHYDYTYSDHYPGRIPSFIRITAFKNFGKENQSFSIDNVIMDNQSGVIEIGEVRW